MSTVITFAGERLFAQKAQTNQQLDIDTFIFAKVPGLDTSAPIDRNEGLPPVAQRVHQQAVQQYGRLNDNVVIYSTVLDSVTGPFEFNWVGLYSSVNQTLVAIQHVPTVVKTVTAPGVAGNTLNRNFGIEYSGIAALTGITVDPQTWQLDFTARLSGMDELTRQLAADMNGRDWFIGDGFKVVPRATLNTFSVTPGVGYVSGLRIELESEHILMAQAYPQFVYVDAWFDGDASSTWIPKVALTVSGAEMDDYIDAAGVKHYVFKLAEVTAADGVQDLRQQFQLLKRDNADKIYTRNFKSVVDMKAAMSADSKQVNFALMLGQKVCWRGYYHESDGGSNWGIVKQGVVTDDGLQFFEVGNGYYVEANLKSEKINLKKAGIKEGAAAEFNSARIQACIDFLNSTYSVVNGLGRGGGIMVIPEGVFDYAGMQIKIGVDVYGRGMNRSVLQLVGDDIDGIWCAARDTKAYQDQVSYGTFKDFSLVPKDPVNLKPLNQTMWNVVGFSRWSAEKLYVGWCGGVVGIRATGSKPAGSGGPAMWYNTFKEIFVERPQSWPAGGVGWLLGEGNDQLEQITTWTILGGRTSGIGMGINIQGANTVSFLGHVVESSDVKIGDESGSRTTRNVGFYPAYFEGAGTINITNKAYGTGLYGDFITGYTVIDNGQNTTRLSGGAFKSACNSVGNDWSVEIQNGAVRRPKFIGSQLPGLDLVNSNGSVVTLLSAIATSSATSAFQCRYNNFANVLFSVGTTEFTLATDGVGNIGSASNRCGTFFSTSGSINTSDENDKTPLETISEQEKKVAIRIKENIKKFKFRDAVEAKGDMARWHFGVGAQTVKAAFEEFGLDGFDYGVLCFDEWDDTYQNLEEVRAIMEVRHSDGSTEEVEQVIQPARQELMIKAGSRYGIRYSELSMFLLSTL